MARSAGVFAESDLEPAERVVAYAEAALDRIGSAPARSSDRDLLEEAASILSHDVGNPLAVARGHLELARTTGEDEHLERIETAHGRLEELVEGVVTLLRTGRHAGGADPVDLADAVDKARSAVDLQAAELELADATTIQADRNALCRILENVFRNAVDHAGPDVHIRVGLLDGGFYVEDDGPGVPPDERDRVFEWGVSDAEDHTGAGLHIVERLVEAQGWEISLTEGTAGGARFEITGVERA